MCPSQSDAVTAYTYNYRVGSIGVTLASIDYPTLVPTFIDGNGTQNTTSAGIKYRSPIFLPQQNFTGWQGRAARLGYGQNYSTSGASFPASTRHLEGANYAFFDGHVKWLKAPGQTLTYVSGTSDDTFFSPATSGPAPAFKGLDYDIDGEFGTDTIPD